MVQLESQSTFFSSSARIFRSAVFWLACFFAMIGLRQYRDALYSSVDFSHGRCGVFCQISSRYSIKLAVSANSCPARDRFMPNMPLDAIDRKILALLQQDGRMSIADLSGTVGLSVSVFVSIKLESQREEALERFSKAITRWPEVLECYLMTGPRDYLLRVVVADLAAYERFLKQKLTRLNGVGSIESSFALEQVKYTNVLPLDPSA